MKCYWGNKTGNPEWAVSLHLAHSGSQSQCRIWFILPACGACPIIIIILLLSESIMTADTELFGGIAVMTHCDWLISNLGKKNTTTKIKRNRLPSYRKTRFPVCSKFFVNKVIPKSRIQVTQHFFTRNRGAGMAQW